MHVLYKSKYAGRLREKSVRILFYAGLCAICVTIRRWTEVKPALHDTTLVIASWEICAHGYGVRRELRFCGNEGLLPVLHWCSRSAASHTKSDRWHVAFVFSGSFVKHIRWLIVQRVNCHPVTRYTVAPYLG